MPSMTLEQAFEMAVQHQQAGRPADAEALCRQILTYKPDHADALHMLGILGHRAGHAEAGVDLIKKAIASNPNVGAYHSNLGLAMATTGQIPQAIEYLQDHFNSREHFWYGHYYAAHAMHQVGGKEWEDWYARLVRYFIPHQAPDGSWARMSRHEVGPVYQTSIAVIALSVPAGYLPIFQR